MLEFPEKNYLEISFTYNYYFISLFKQNGCHPVFKLWYKIYLFNSDLKCKCELFSIYYKRKNIIFLIHLLT